MSARLISKPFLTYSELIDKLKNEKNLEIKDIDSAISLMKRYSYFSLISGYKKLFKEQNSDKYKLHTSIEDIHQLYLFDDELRLLFLKYILKIEKHIKSLISYAFCDCYGEEQEHFLCENNYSTLPKNKEQVEKLIRKIQEIISSQSKTYLEHQQKHHSNVPLWVVAHAATFGIISKMYSLLIFDIQSQISKEFIGVSEGLLVRILDLLAQVRNVCAHSERLYDFKARRVELADTEIHKKLNIARDKNNRYKKGKQDLFAVIICLKYLLPKEEFNKFSEELSLLLEKLTESSRNINKSQMYKQMGLFDNWEQVTLLELSDLP